MVRIVEQSGRVAPDATRVVSADRQFGNAAPRLTNISGAPTEAFGDPSGKMAVANAMANVGNMFFDLGQRDIALKKAEEDKTKQTKRIKTSIADADVRRQIKEENLENNWTPDQMEKEYERRMGEARRGIWEDDTEWKFTDKGELDEEIDLLLKGLSTDYKSGEIAERRVDAVRGQTIQALDALALNAAHAGREGSTDKAKATYQEMLALLADESTAAVFGAAGVAQLKDKYIKEATINLITEVAERNPEDALALVGPDGLVTAMLGEEMAAGYRETAQKIADDRKREIRIETEQAEEQVVGTTLLDIELGRTNKMKIMNLPISDGAKARLLSAHDSRAREIAVADAQKKAAEAVISEAMKYGATVDKGDQKHVDKWWEDVQTTFDTMPDAEKQAAYMAEQVKQLKIFKRMPTQLRTQWEAAILGSDTKEGAAKAQKMANQLSILFRDAPELAADFNPDVKRIVYDIQSGTPPAKAIERNENARRLPAPIRESLQNEATSTFSNTNREGVKQTIANAHNQRFPDREPLSANQVTAASIAEYQQWWTEEYVANGGNKAAADAEASNQYFTKYGPSSLSPKAADGSSPVVAYPVEAHGAYAVEQLPIDMAKFGYLPDDGWMFEPIANPRKPGTYLVRAYIPGQELNSEIVKDGDGNNVAWKPDMKRYSQSTTPVGTQKRKNQKNNTDTTPVGLRKERY